MLPSSTNLETLFDEFRAIDSALAKTSGGKVTNTDLISRIGSCAKDWLKQSQQLRVAPIVPEAVLDKYDGCAEQVLTATRAQTRATSYQSKLHPIVSGLYDDVVIPLIKHEGSPSQVSGRQIVSTFTGAMTTDEEIYIGEAADCVAAHCNRAAIVMLWAAAMARFHEAIMNVGFATYNAALTTTAAKNGAPFNKLSVKDTISSLAELQRTRDFSILVIGMEIWNYDLQAYQELDRLLGTRNDAAHPGTFQPGALDVQQFANKLRTLVFDKIPT